MDKKLVTMSDNVTTLTAVTVILSRADGIPVSASVASSVGQLAANYFHSPRFQTSNIIATADPASISASILITSLISMLVLCVRNI